MEIEGVSLPVTPAVEFEPPEPPVSEPLSAEPPPVEEEELPGVIRHLMEGHYTGVSDVRLRINFADVLAAIEQEQIQAAAAEQINNMLGAIGVTIEVLLGTGEASEGAEEEPPEAPIVAAAGGPTDEPPPEPPAEEPANGPTEEQSAAVLESQGTFVLAVDLSKQEFMTSEAPSQDALVAGLNDAFDTFVTSLNSVFEPPPEPEPEPVEPPSIMTTEGTVGDVEPDEAPETEPPAESGFDYQGFIESLTNTFLLAIAELANAMDAVNILPELSEPNGNGGAYAKFVAIYNELQNPEEPDDGAVV